MPSSLRVRLTEKGIAQLYPLARRRSVDGALTAAASQSSQPSSPSVTALAKMRRRETRFFFKGEMEREEKFQNAHFFSFF